MDSAVSTEKTSRYFDVLFLIKLRTVRFLFLPYNIYCDISKIGEKLNCTSLLIGECWLIFVHSCSRALQSEFFQWLLVETSPYLPKLLTYFYYFNILFDKRRSSRKTDFEIIVLKQISAPLLDFKIKRFLRSKTSKMRQTEKLCITIYFTF